MPILFAELEEVHKIKGLSGNEEVKKHLHNLGLAIGCEVTVVNKLGKNLILKVKEARIAISEELAKRIMI